MALFVRRVLTVSIISNFEFTKLNYCDFIAKNQWPPIHPTSVHWIITFGGNAGVLSQAATKPKRCAAADWDHLTRESNKQCCKRLPQVIAGTRRPVADILKKKNGIHVMDTDSYI